MSYTIYAAIPLMLVLAVLQTAVLSRVPAFGVTAQLPLLFALSWGVLRGINEGVIWAFIGGFALDLFSVTPVGTTALAYITAVLAVLWLQKSLPFNRFFSPMLLAAGATAIGLIVYQIALRLLGFSLTLQTFSTLPQLAALNAAVMLPVYWVLTAVVQFITPRRVSL